MMKFRHTLLLTALLTTPLQAQDRDLVQAAKGILTILQGNSFAANREYCGLIGENAQGQLVSTGPRKGRVDSCAPRDFHSNDIEPIASFHTHGAYDQDVDAEVPSLGDLNADTDEGLRYGFVSSPGGRFWVIDTAKQEVRLICDLGCLPPDPRFMKGDFGPVQSRYTRRDLEERDAS